MAYTKQVREYCLKNQGAVLHPVRIETAYENDHRRSVRSGDVL